MTTFVKTKAPGSGPLTEKCHGHVEPGKKIKNNESIPKSTSKALINRAFVEVYRKTTFEHHHLIIRHICIEIEILY